MQIEQIKIFAHYGYENQLEKLVEEMRELEQVILHDTDNIEHLQEEMADVLTLIEQFMYCCEGWTRKIYEIQDFKVKRQIKRMENEVIDENMS